LLPPPIQALTRQVPQSALYPTPESPQGVWIPAQAEPSVTSAGVFPGARARHRRSPNASLAWARERLMALEKARQAALELQPTRIPRPGANRQSNVAGFPAGLMDRSW